MGVGKKIRIGIIATLLAALCFLVALAVLGLRQRARAEGFLDAITKLNLGISTFAEAERIADVYGGRSAVGTETTQCTSGECYLHFYFPNPRNMFPFSIVPRVALRGTIHAKNDRVTGIDVAYLIDSVHFTRAGGYDVRDSLTARADSTYDPYRWLTPGFGIAQLYVDKHGMPWVVEVRLTPEATSAERKRAYALNLSCVARLYGCASPSSVVPHDLRD